MRPIRLAAALVLAVGTMGGAAWALDATGAAFLPVQGASTAPAGAASICATYDWACAGATHAAPVGADVLKLAAKINRSANAAIRPVSDLEQYSSAERWALPTARGGDCEDYALFKKMKLVEAGVSPDRLLMAAVLDRRRNIHAVLVLRTDMGDFILDNLTDRVLPWNKTGYAYLRMQDPRQPSRWIGTYVQAEAGLSS